MVGLGLPYGLLKLCFLVFIYENPPQKKKQGKAQKQRSKLSVEAEKQKSREKEEIKQAESKEAEK